MFSSKTNENFVFFIVLNPDTFEELITYFRSAFHVFLLSQEYQNVLSISRCLHISRIRYYIKVHLYSY